jgi:hypothetical protein
MATFKSTLRSTIVRSTVHGFSRGGVCILLLSAFGFAGQPEAIPTPRDPAELIRKAVENEIKAADHNTVHFLFRSIKTSPKGSTSRIYVETKDVTAGLIIGYNGKTLTPEQRKQEEDRVERFVDNPEELQKKRQQESDNAEHTMRIVRAMPDAFLFEYAGEELGTDSIGRVGEPLVKLKFQPNPRYEPPSHVEDVLTGMQGYVLVDAIHHRIAKIDGTLFKEVAFGWGILGHLDRGGQFIVLQQDVGDDLWEFSSMTLNFTGKILLFKNLAISSTEVFSGFKRVPADLTFAQALELLKKEETSDAADNSSASKLADR